MSNYSYAIVHEDLYQPLLETSNPELFRVNAFRLLGLPTRATERDLKKQSEKLQMMAKFGGAIQIGGPLPLVPPPAIELVQAAAQRLRDPEQRLMDEFFWFWTDAAPKSDEGLAALNNQDIKSAAEVWSRQADSSDEHGIAAHNLAVLYHVMALDVEHVGLSNAMSDQMLVLRDSYWHEGFARWLYLLGADRFWESLAARIRELNDPRLTTDIAQQLRRTLPVALLRINVQLALRAVEQKALAEVERQRRLIEQSGFPAEDVAEAIRLGMQPLREQIKAACGAAEKESEAEPQTAHTTSRRLLEQARPLLVAIDNLLPTDYQARDDVRDEVAQSAFKCQTLYGNTTKDWKGLQELFELTRPYATSETLREKIAEGLGIVKGNIEYQDSGKCWFCKEEEGVSGWYCEVPMHGNVTRTWVGTGTRVQWQTLNVQVPRCQRCYLTHQRDSKFRGRGALLGLLASILILVLTYLGISDVANVFDGVICMGSLFLLIAPIIVGYSIAGALSKISSPPVVQPLNIKTSHPSVVKLRGQGWSLGAKPST